jgi:hypothetical protein
MTPSFSTRRTAALAATSAASASLSGPAKPFRTFLKTCCADLPYRPASNFARLAGSLTEHRHRVGQRLDRGLHLRDLRDGLTGRFLALQGDTRGLLAHARGFVRLLGDLAHVRGDFLDLLHRFCVVRG